MSKISCDELRVYSNLKGFIPMPFGCGMSHLIQGERRVHACCGKCVLERLDLCQPIVSSWWGKLR